MIDEGFRLKEFLPLCRFDLATELLIPTLQDWRILEELHENLQKFKVVSKLLQTGELPEQKRTEVNFHTCRNVFDKLISMFPAERGKKGIKHWLGPDAETIHDKMFERAIERLHAGEKIDDLPVHLKRKVEHFKPPAAASSVPADPNRHFLSVSLD